MMKVMRSGVLSGVFVVFLVLAAVSLVLTDWTGSFRSGVGSHDVAKIGRDRITQNEFAQLASRALRAENISPQNAYQMGLINNLLTSEIWNRMLVRAAHGYGIAISDDVLVDHLQELAKPVAEAEKTTPSAVIKRFLESQNMSEAQFLTGLRRELVNQMARDVVASSGTAVSAPMIKDLMAHEGQTRDIRYLYLKDVDAKNVPFPTAEELAAYYEQRKSAYMQPERRDVQIATLPIAAIKAGVTVSDAEISAFYDSHKEDMQVAETRVLEMVIYKLDEEAKAKKLVADAKAPGANLTDIAKKTGKPMIAREQGFTQAGLMPEMADAVFNVKQGDLIGPIKTAIGWHVARLKDIKPAGTRSLEDAKADIKKELEAEKTGALIDQKLEALDKAVESNDSLDTLAKAQGMSVATFKAITREGLDANGVDLFKDLAAVKAPLLSATFEGTETGKLLGPLELPSGDVAVLVLNTIDAAKPKPLDAIKDDLNKSWTVEKRREGNIMLAQRYFSELVEKKKTLDDVARQYNIAPVELKDVKRGEKNLPVDFDRGIWSRFFSEPVGKPILQPMKTGVVMAVVTRVQLPDEAKLDVKASATQALLDQTIKQQSEEATSQFMGTLNDRYNARVNDRLIKQMFAPKDTAE